MSVRKNTIGQSFKCSNETLKTIVYKVLFQFENFTNVR